MDGWIEFIVSDLRVLFYSYLLPFKALDHDDLVITIFFSLKENKIVFPRDFYI
jgi:hypothetical protein